MPRPYSIGFHGHAHICDCEKCAQSRAEWVVSNVRGTVSGDRVIDPERTVYVREYTVRPHLRRNANHMSKFPRTKAVVQQALVELARRRKK